MRICLLLFLIGLLKFNASAQDGNWVWVKGSNTTNPQVTYPIQGIADALNNPLPLCEAANWIDLDGNFWIFGGYARNAYSDLWKYNTTTNVWTWIKGPGVPNQNSIYGIPGVASDTAMPGARFRCSTWTDGNGDLWLFSGAGLNDLWKYNIIANKWTWMGGNSSLSAFNDIQNTSPGSIPNSRNAALTWVDDNNNLWMFGGANYSDANGDLSYSDLWRYNIISNKWIWVNGPDTIWSKGNYGIKGVETSSNLPPSRRSSVTWKDNSGNFYLYGGGFLGDGQGYVISYNDVWRYNLQDNMWTWISGDSTINKTGNYPQYCIDTEYVASSKFPLVTCKSSCNANGTFMFGGNYNNNFNQHYWTLNDLWSFNNGADKWKWVNGTTVPNDTGNDGVIGIANSSNLIPARFGNCEWVDNKGVLWIFGGGHDAPAGSNTYNDLWKFIPDTACVKEVLSGGIQYHISKNNICKGDTLLLVLIDSNTYISPLTAITKLDSTHLLLYPDSTTTYILSGQSYCGANDSVGITISVYNQINVQITADNSIFCPGDSMTLSVPYGYNSYRWSDGETGSYIYAKQGGSYNITVTENPTCSAVSDTVTLQLYPTTPVPVIISGDTLIAHGETSYAFYRNDTLVLAANPQRNSYVATHTGTYTVIGIDFNGCSVSSLPIVITGIHEIEANNIIIYPNPAKAYLTGSFTTTPQKLIAEIISPDGKVLKQGIPVNNQNFEIDISSLSSGVYFLVMQSGEEKWVKKFVKQ